MELYDLAETLMKLYLFTSPNVGRRGWIAGWCGGAYLLVGGGHPIWEEAIELLVNPRQSEMEQMIEPRFTPTHTHPFEALLNQPFTGTFGTFSITPGKGQCAAARSRMREGRGGILFVADTRSRRNSQKETPSLRQVFLRLAKVSRQRRPRSLRVPPLTFRFLT